MPNRSSSIRLSKELDEAVRKEAADRNLSFNALVNRVLTRFTEWDRHAERFGMLATTREGLISLFEAIPEARLKSISESFAERTTPELLDSWEGMTDARGLVSFLESYSRYGGLGALSVQDHGSSIGIRLHHRLGWKGSVVIAGWLGSFFERILGQEVEFSKGIDSISGEIKLQKRKEK